MKQIIALAILAVATMGGAQAQENTKPTKDAAVMEQRNAQRAAQGQDASAQLASELGLNAEQTAKMKEVDDLYVTSMERLRMSTTDRAVLQEQSRILAEQRDERLKGILEPAQYERMMAMRQRKADESRQKEAEMKRAGQ
jgi:opacity protein-like surface antigen